MKTLVVGHVTHDRYEEGLVAGGCAFYGARVHARLEGQTQLVTVVGKDFSCENAIGDLDVVARRAGETTTFANYYPEDGLRQQLVETRAPRVEPELVDDGLDADLVHLAPVCGEIDLEQWLDATSDALVAINVQGWLKQPGPVVDPAGFEQIQSRGVRQAASRVIERPWAVQRQHLDGVDIACLSEEDLAHQTDLLERLVDAVEVVALTRGAEGSRIYVDGTATDIGICPVEPVDPTGAGDVYAAAFTHQIAAGTDPVEAGRWAAAAASIVIEDIGARALSRLEEKLERRRSKPLTPPKSVAKG